MFKVKKLLNWYKKEGRELPWRETTDPYFILVSEVMLQQTQVSHVLDFYERWLKEFPDWQTLAKASNADVVHAWAGLGYNRRALMLRDIAKAVVENGVPGTEEEWRKLKGIGPYTAAALTVFSLRMKAMPIDTNIRRVIGRIFLRKHYPQLSDDAEIGEVGERELMSVDGFHDVPQALFDLATMHCTKVPNCAECPMQDVCASADDFLSGSVEVPKRMVKKARERIHRNKKYPDRIYRGRILKLVREQGEVDVDEIGVSIDNSFDAALDDEWVGDMISRLEKDGFVKNNSGLLVLKK